MMEMERLPKVSPSRVVTVKLGGSAMDDEIVVHQLAEDISFLISPQLNFIVVHGGGKEISREMEIQGIKTVKVAGLRITDDATMAIVERVMSRINDRICGIFAEHSVRTEKVMGSDGLLLCKKLAPVAISQKGQKEHVDLGRVGEVERVFPEPLRRIIGKSIVPIVAPLGRSSDGLALNVNADTAAGSIAGASSDEFILLTDVEGVIVPGTDVVRVAESLRISDIRKLIEVGVIREGMLPKVEACIHAIESGVKSAMIINGLGDHPLKAALAGERIGTRILP